MITENEQAPSFTMTDIENRIINLTDFQGKKVLLTFFRVESCPFCNLRVHELIRNHKELNSKGIELIAFFHSTKEEVNKYAGKQNPPFSIIPDPEYITYTKYHIKTSVGGLFLATLRLSSIITTIKKGFFNLKTLFKKPILPADFLIDENGKVYKAYYGKDFGDHINMQEVYNWED